MSIITRSRKQTAVLWPYVSINKFGEKVVGSPSETKVRWEDVNEEFLDNQGQIQMSRAHVFVGLDILPGSILMLGRLTDITDAVNIKENNGAWEVRKFDKPPNLKATEFLRTAFL